MSTTLKLAKGKKLQLRKSNGTNLRSVEVRLFWKTPDNAKHEYDLDATALQLMDSSNASKYPFGCSIGIDTVCYYHQAETVGIISSGDDQSGGDNDGEANETLTIEFDKLSNKTTSVPVVLTIDSAKQRQQTFNDVSDAYVELVDVDTNEILATAVLTDLELGSIGALFVVFKREDAGWTFENVSTGYQKDLLEFLTLFGVDAEY